MATSVAHVAKNFALQRRPQVWVPSRGSFYNHQFSAVVHVCTSSAAKSVKYLCNCKA